MSLGTAADAKDDDSDHNKGNALPIPIHARVLQAQINDNKASIENIELTPGPKGDKGDPGTNGVDGQDGADGLDGLDGTTPWTELDGYSSISTTGSIRISDDPAICDDTYKGTIRFNSTTDTFEGCDGTAWVSLNSQGLGDVNYAIGDAGPAGGIVFYITPGSGGLHGLEAASTDQDGGSGVPWGCYGTEITGADGIAVGTGAQNTSDILAGCSEVGTAAKLADAYA